MIDQNLLMNDLLHVSGADRVVLQEDISVKDNALVDTILEIGRASCRERVLQTV